MSILTLRYSSVAWILPGAGTAPYMSRYIRTVWDLTESISKPSVQVWCLGGISFPPFSFSFIYFSPLFLFLFTSYTKKNKKRKKKKERNGQEILDSIDAVYPLGAYWICAPSINNALSAAWETKFDMWHRCHISQTPLHTPSESIDLDISRNPLNITETRAAHLYLTGLDRTETLCYN